MNFETYAAGILRDCLKFYQDPKHLEEFEQWKKQRDEEKKCEVKNEK